MDKIDTTTLGPISTMRGRDRDAEIVEAMAKAIDDRWAGRWTMFGDRLKLECRRDLATAALAAYRNATGDDGK